MIFDFSHVGRRVVSSQCANFKNTAHSTAEQWGLPLLPKLPRAKDIFDRLLVSKQDLNMIDHLVLMCWNSPLWQTPEGAIVMRHWWEGALSNRFSRFLLMIRVVMADSTYWPGPGPVITLMQNQMQYILAAGKWPIPEQAAVLQKITEKNAVGLAQIAIQNSFSVQQVMKNNDLPRNLPIVQRAEAAWFDLWLGLSKEPRMKIAHHVRDILNSDLDIEQQVMWTRFILDHRGFSKKMDTLKKQVENFSEITYWLSACARNIEFKKLFSTEERKLLSCWIGAGNYAAFESIIRRIGTISDDNDRSLNRYIFWRNYQFDFEESWLLLPEQMSAAYPEAKNLPNIKKLIGGSYPIGLFKIKGYYFIQEFVATGGVVDLVMTRESVDIEKFIESSEILRDCLYSVSPCFIHDYMFKWQADAASALDTHFDIRPIGDFIDVTITGLKSDYKKEVKKPDFIADRKSSEKGISRWVHSAKRRHSAENFSLYALSARKYGLI